MSSPLMITMAEWNPEQVRYMQPKAVGKGIKIINIVSTQTNRAMHLTLPLMQCWGINDNIDENTGEPNGKFVISLQFPRDPTPASTVALEKFKIFENQLIDDAVKNSEAWFDRKQGREICEFSYFPFLKYSKNQETKLVDKSKPPSLRPKVPCYDGVWKTEVYDPTGNLLFPNDLEGSSPAAYVVKNSLVSSIIQCGGIWVGAKNWGLTWKLVQCIVKPQVMVTAFGKCHIKLSPEDMEGIYAPQEPEKQKPDTHFEDSDEEKEDKEKEDKEKEDKEKEEKEKEDMEKEDKEKEEKEEKVDVVPILKRKIKKAPAPK